MPSLNLDLDYFDHPKTRRLVGVLGRGAEVLPIRLWCYCGKYHSRDGSLAGYSAEELESVVGWWGKPGALLGALLGLGFLDAVEGGYVVHDWTEHAGHFEAYKAKAKHAAVARWGTHANAPSIPGASPKDASSNAPAVHCKAGQGIPPPPPLAGGASVRSTRAGKGSALVGAHPEKPDPRAGVTEPAWVGKVFDAMGHALRPDVPDELVNAAAAWRQGADVPEPERWEEILEDALEKARPLDRQPVPVRALFLKR